MLGRIGLRLLVLLYIEPIGLISQHMVSSQGNQCARNEQPLLLQIVIFFSVDLVRYLEKSLGGAKKKLDKLEGAIILQMFLSPFRRESRSVIKGVIWRAIVSRGPSIIDSGSLRDLDRVFFLRWVEDVGHSSERGAIR